jgi:hypothetical protein
MVIRSDADHLPPESRNPLQGELQEAFVTNERHELLGEALPAEGPQACAGAAAENDRSDGAHSAMLSLLASASTLPSFPHKKDYRMPAGM